MSGALRDWLDGVADEDACRELRARLDGDPMLRQALLAHARDEALLAAALRPPPDLAARVLAGLRPPGARTRLQRAVMRDVRARRRARPRWPIILAAAAVLALGTVLLLAGGRGAATATSPAIGRVLVAGGAVLLRDGTASPLAAGDPLLAGDRLRDGSASCELGGAAVDLTVAGELALLSGDRLRLHAGRVAVDAAPRPSGHALAIATPEATATVIGTAFTLASAGGATRLDVTHGRVRLDGAGGAVEVGADAWAETRANAVPVAHAWLPLFAAFADWRQQHGTWSLVDATVRGAGSAGRARILSPGDHGDLELRCRLRITGAPLAEVQVGDYNWFFEVPATAGWIAIDLRQHGPELSCSADGRPLAAQAGAGLAPRRGPIAFYVRAGDLEIADARIRE